MCKISEFTIQVPESKLDRIRKRVEDYAWFPAPADRPDWQYGMSFDTLRTIQDHWLKTYDWRAEEDRLNTLPHFTAEIDSHQIHFLHIVGEAGGQRPLLITHGWPGSFIEFLDVIEPLAYPSRRGGDAADAFDLIIPSLPGYDFSGTPAAPVGPRRTATLWDQLMRDALGYDTYLAQGGDWGALVTSWLGHAHGTHNSAGGCAGIHLNMIGFRPTPASPKSDAETAWMKRSANLMQAEGAYLMQQATKPQTLATALMDSPMGTAAWILEKFHGWSDLGDRGLLDVYSVDRLLTNLMLYLVNDAIATSVWFYAGFFEEGGNALPEGVRCETQTGFAAFPNDKVYPPPPRSWAERAYNITYWQDMKEGGHFAAMEKPALFVESVRAWAATAADRTGR